MPVTGGNVYLTYNSSTGYNCVVTVRNSSGSAVYMDTGVKKSGSSTWSYDAGQYKTYAGPIYVYGAGSCVDWYGTIGSSRQVKYDDACG
ncbi:hypothetical protein [Streptomyces sp. NPDC088725]|uniref:hypothetical protein n=1 Tax=Streptomyces sp. NPDC088725 TaxID=3365873 RepID=UPI00381E8139